VSDPNAHGSVRPGATKELDTPAIALAVGAHPDDVEFGCGGTLAKWASRGCLIHHIVCTDGSKGSWDPDIDVRHLVLQRRAEQEEASRRLGGSGDVVFLARVDGELRVDDALRSEIALWIRRRRPDVILGHDPWKRYRLHPDHRNAGFAVTDAIVAARDPHFFPEQDLPPHRPKALLLWEADEADHVEDISGFDDVKLQALMAHGSQMRSTMKIGSGEDAGDEAKAFADRLANRHRHNGEPFGVGMAEVFKLISDL
jgi:LmbE family N-acetylglucosaminyl deacetylase